MEPQLIKVLKQMLDGGVYTLRTVESMAGLAMGVERELINRRVENEEHFYVISESGRKAIENV